MYGLFGVNMKDEDIDFEVLRLTKSRFPSWLSDDDEFSPTTSWLDCGPLIEMFEMDVGPDYHRWRAWCFREQGQHLGVVSDNLKTAICLAIIEYEKRKK
jgi:hypothetical protein